VAAEFKDGEKALTIQLSNLSDGEKCFFICALLIAITREGQPFTCFWDEPDNYLAPQEVSSTMLALRRAFKKDNQIIITSHNPDAIRCFTDENTIILSRASRLVSPIAKTLSQLHVENVDGGPTLDLWLQGDLDT
jgi:predicted ATPase